MRVNLNIPDELVAQIDAKAKSLFVNRTAWIIMALSEKLKQDDALISLPAVLETMRSMTNDKSGDK